MPKLQRFYLQAFPTSFQDDALGVLTYLENKMGNYHSDYTYNVYINKECIKLPSRIYWHVPNNDQFDNFSLLQRQILWCLYTRHHDGFVRQNTLENLLKTELTYFMIPFIFQLLGEYVQEILKIIEPHINKKNHILFEQFILENPKYFQTTESRIISYWNEYYRHTQNKYFKDYIGSKIIVKLKKLRE